jgi:hypothetical protein
MSWKAKMRTQWLIHSKRVSVQGGIETYIANALLIFLSGQTFLLPLQL